MADINKPSELFLLRCREVDVPAMYSKPLIVLKWMSIKFNVCTICEMYVGQSTEQQHYGYMKGTALNYNFLNS